MEAPPGTRRYVTHMAARASASVRASASARTEGERNIGGGKPSVARLANVLSTIVLVALAVLVIAFAGVRLVGLTPYAVLSGSMEPLYPVGSLIYVRDTDPASIEPGDSVTFDNGHDQVVTHQAYEVDDASGLIRTQGINNRSTDGTILHDADPVPFDRVIGVPVACVPVMGYVNAWCTSMPGIAIVVALAVLAAAMPWLAHALDSTDESLKANENLKAGPSPKAPGASGYVGKHMR